ncbi:MAG: hypothetical protein R2680_00310 [Nitrososphaeraceae archaeon]
MESYGRSLASSSLLPLSIITLGMFPNTGETIKGMCKRKDKG